MDPKNPTASAIDAGKEIATQSGSVRWVVDVDGNPIEGGVPFLVLPTVNGGMKVEGLAELLPPAYHRYSQTLQTEGSFVAYINRFKMEGTMVFADRKARKFLALIDHPTNSDDTPTRGTHVAYFQTELSREWQAWSKFAGKYHPQKDFAEFLEEHALDICKPDPATMLEVASQLDVTKNAEFKQGTRLDNGEVQFSYIEKVSAKAAKAEIPRKFTLSIPVFHGGAQTEVECLFKYHQAEGILGLRVDMHRAEYLLDSVFDGLCDAIESETGRDVLVGWPNTANVAR